MAAPEQHFPEDYRAARRAFLSAAADAGFGTLSRAHPAAAGRDGKPLFLDTVSIGRRDAGKALLVIAGTHGVEGYFGSGVLTGALRARFFDNKPDDAKIVLLHALNPFGFSWDRRTDENNIDVNRNFVDHAHPPENPAYEELAAALEQNESTDDGDAPLRAFVAAHGEAALQKAISRGQYRHADGLCFGGFSPSWSRTMLFDVLGEELGTAKRLVVLDLHTGLGAPGESQIISEDAPGAAAYRRAKTIWRDVRSSFAGEAVSPPAEGLIGPALQARASGETTCATLEIGTAPLSQVFAALWRDNWLHGVAGRDHRLAGEIARDMRAAFFPPDAEWKRRAFRAGLEALAAARAALG
jgi:hypothetical protein